MILNSDLPGTTVCIDHFIVFCSQHIPLRNNNDFQLEYFIHRDLGCVILVFLFILFYLKSVHLQICFGVNPIQDGLCHGPLDNKIKLSVIVEVCPSQNII